MKKNYINIQKNHLAFIIIFFLIVLIVLATLVCFLGFHSLIGTIVCCSLLILVALIVFFLIKTGKISRIKVSCDGMLVNINKESLMFMWSEFNEIKIKKIMGYGRRSFIKFTFYSNYSKEKSFDMYSQDYFIEFLIEYCTSEEFINKLKAIQEEIWNNY